MALVDVAVEDVSAADERAAHETRPNGALDSAAEAVAVANDADRPRGGAAGDLTHPAASGEIVFACDAGIRRVPRLDAASHRRLVIGRDRMLPGRGGRPLPSG